MFCEILTKSLPVETEQTVCMLLVIYKIIDKICGILINKWAITPTMMKNACAASAGDNKCHSSPIPLAHTLHKIWHMTITCTCYSWLTEYIYSVWHELMLYVRLCSIQNSFRSTDVCMSPEWVLQRKYGHTYHNIPSGLCLNDLIFFIDTHQRHNYPITGLVNENGVIIILLNSPSEEHYNIRHNTTIRANRGDIRRHWHWHRRWYKKLHPLVDGFFAG